MLDKWYVERGVALFRDACKMSGGLSTALAREAWAQFKFLYLLIGVRVLFCRYIQFPIAQKSLLMS